MINCRDGTVLTGKLLNHNHNHKHHDYDKGESTGPGEGPEARTCLQAGFGMQVHPHLTNHHHDRVHRDDVHPPHHHTDHDHDHDYDDDSEDLIWITISMMTIVKLHQMLLLQE